MQNINYTALIECITKKANVTRATKYVAPNLIARATRKMFGKKIDNRHNIELIVTVGKPNYVERDFIKKCKKAGETFPVKNIQVKLYSPKKVVLKKKSR